MQFHPRHGQADGDDRPSGCGKSTLIRLLAGFERPTSGTITIDDKPVTGPGVDRLVVFQETALFPWMSTYDNIMYGPRARNEDTAEMREFAETLLQKVGLAAFRARNFRPSSRAVCSDVPSWRAP